jgi:transcriptional regulator with XRE-family HTH domain
MKSKFTNILIAARRDAGYTQEQAAERIGLSTRSVASYEQGNVPPEDVVVKMMQVYKNTYIGYAYLSLESAVGRLILPEIQQTGGAASTALQLHISMGKAEKVFGRLEVICSDDVISLAEATDYKRCIDELDGLMKSVMSLKIRSPENCNKKRPCVRSARPNQKMKVW